jgi:hypothetical protein
MYARFRALVGTSVIGHSDRRRLSRRQWRRLRDYTYEVFPQRSLCIFTVYTYALQWAKSVEGASPSSFMLAERLQARSTLPFASAEALSHS